MLEKIFAGMECIAFLIIFAYFLGLENHLWVIYLGWFFLGFPLLLIFIVFLLDKLDDQEIKKKWRLK